jgi:hypothetical protein
MVTPVTRLIEPGQRFGRGVILEEVRISFLRGGKPATRRGARLLCDCGNIYNATVGELFRDQRGTRSCGCLRREVKRLTKTFVDENGRVCTECGLYKEWDSYPTNTDCIKDRDPKCKACTSAHAIPVSREYRLALKHQVMNGYGGACACCGESEIAFLTIDHINNDGAEHRRSSKFAKANRLYRWLRDNNYPQGFQVLCSNCNTAKNVVGVCPHQIRREA